MDKILIEVVCPATSKHYDFWISRKLSIGKAKEKLMQEIQSFEKSENIFCDGENTFLYLCENGRILALQQTLEQAGITSGSCLMLV